MAQKDLIPVRTKEEAKERGRNGGLKSGKVRKKKKQVKDLLQTLLAAKANPKDIKKVQLLYPDLTIKTIEDILNLAMIREGTKGNVQAYNAVYNRIEGKAQQKTEVTGKDGGAIEISKEVKDLSDEELEEYLKTRLKK